MNQRTYFCRNGRLSQHVGVRNHNESLRFRAPRMNRIPRILTLYSTGIIEEKMKDLHRMTLFVILLFDTLAISEPFKFNANNFKVSQSRFIDAFNLITKGVFASSFFTPLD